jgi:hypothetical protein
VKNSCLGFLVAVAGATGAHAASISFYVEDTMPEYRQVETLIDNAGGSETRLVNRRFSEATSYSVPRFNPALGTLDRVELVFGIDTAPVATNRVAVALDTDCGVNCDKQLAVDATFAFGMDVFVALEPGSGPLRQFFDVSVQALLNGGDFDLSDATFFPAAGAVPVLDDTVNGDFTIRTLTDIPTISQFVGAGDVFFDVGPAVRANLALTCRTPAGTDVTCDEDVFIEAGGAAWAAQVRYSYTEDRGDSFDLAAETYRGESGFSFTATGAVYDGDLFFANPAFTRPTAVPLPAGAGLLLAACASLATLRAARAVRG